MENIKIIGVGGGGIKMINQLVIGSLQGEDVASLDARMIIQKVTENLKGAEIMVADTKKDSLLSAYVFKKILLKKIAFDVRENKGFDELMAENRKVISAALQGATVVFIACGLGGKTGTNMASMIADCAKELGAVTIALVSLPFNFESPQRQKRAAEGYKNLKPKVNTIVKINCDKFLMIAPPGSSLDDIFYYVNESIRGTVKNLIDMDKFQEVFKTAGEIIFASDNDD
ncbi:MAG: hypothetical protein IKZ53_10010 [Selenomonadaceae bacterium]|nr:hypothetical protein [Selenomonadaceae bacterium]